MDLGLIGVFGGFFIVPLYALVQQRSRREVMSRVIGANSILNAVFMVVAALLGALALQRGPDDPAAAAAHRHSQRVRRDLHLQTGAGVPAALHRVAAGALHLSAANAAASRTFPTQGPALLICNHVGFADAIVISAACPRPIRFIMESSIFSIPVLSTIFRGMKAIPVAPAKEDPEVYERAFQIVAQRAARRPSRVHLSRKAA